MSTSSKERAANRINAQKSHGPINTTSTRFNAIKHGLLAVGITELDDPERYRVILNSLREERAPVGTMETLIVDSLALEIIRLERSRLLEARQITAELNPPIHAAGLLGDDLGLLQGAMLDPGLPAAINSESAHGLVNIFQRYESTILNRIFRLLHELERLQRMRKGEQLPAPACVDVSVHASTPGLPVVSQDSAATGTIDSAPTSLEQSRSLPGDEDPTVRAGSGTQVSGSAASEQSIGLPCDLAQTSEEPRVFSDEEPVQIRNEPN